MIKEFSIHNEVRFSLISIGKGALEFEEFHKWLEFLISTRDSIPTYIFDLYDAKEYTIAQSIFYEGARQEYNSSYPFDKNESEALWGIAALRGGDLKEWEVPITEKTALKRMEQYPHVVERFRELFPFVEF